ncbi:MAG: hypothetical protein FWB96_13610 [Defluviitaleaceae bacterium]|nr:hypothetical protein [Defluviitaleaceae bacterium]MCL2264394.1 hypothetical protein [Defluviitaleaceae bacterium]
MKNKFVNIHPEFYNVLKTFTRYRLGELVKTLMRTTAGEELPKTSELSRAFSMLILAKNSTGTENVNIHGDYFAALISLTNYRMGELTQALISASLGEEIEKLSELSRMLLLQMGIKNVRINESVENLKKVRSESGRKGGQTKKSRNPESKTKQMEANQASISKEDKIDMIDKNINDSHTNQSNHQSISMEWLREIAAEIKVALSADGYESVLASIIARIEDADHPPVKNIVNYAKSSLRNAQKAEARAGYSTSRASPKPPPNRFVNFNQREIDFDKYEKLEREYLEQKLGTSDEIAAV